MKHFTFADGVVVVIVFVFCIGFAVFAVSQTFGARSVVHIDAPNASYEYPLDKNQTIEIAGTHGVTVIEIRDGSIRFARSACPNKTCVSVGSVRRANIPIVCLPNGVSAYITGKSEFDAISR